jgi:TonB family protein
MARMILCVALLSALAAPAAAQSGRIYGSVTDPSGGVLPAVDVRATIRDGGGETTRTMRTDGRGSYDFNNLTPGSWLLTMSLPGFETTTRRVDVQIGDGVEWSPTLELGSIQESVTITTAPSDEPVRREVQSAAQSAPPAPAPVRASGPAGAIRVGGSIKPPRKTVHVNPVYPADAAAAGISGVVILSAVIDTDGIVREVTTLRSPNDSLTFAATSALTGWQFTPTLLNGVPVPVRMTATFNFQQQF